MPRLDVDALLADTSKRIVICCGSGGVGKTTVSASLAVRAAEAGRKVVVLTIDPAKRLAQSLGIDELDNTPRPVAAIDTSRGGSLDAMMLDMKRTFDDVVLAHSSPEKAQQIFANPFYEALSTSFSGTQEYMAMEKLGQLHRQSEQTGRWDLIVVDTPPSRSALDFLDAPEHLSNLLDGKMLKLFLMPARGPMKLMSVGVNLVVGAMSKVLGGQLLRDVQTFVTAFEALFGGFRQRAEQTLATLASDWTTFLVVAAPERDALREASFFVDRLAGERMPLAGLILNRVHTSRVAELSAERSCSLAEDLDNTGHDIEVVALRRHAARMQMMRRERDLVARFATKHPGAPTARAFALDSDVTSIDTLRTVAGQLAGGQVAE
ncbi:MAG: ArsA family ATPase [Propionibacterium sp.]|nr:ArsA family ATPase [Propionibacterium sp.]